MAHLTHVSEMEKKCETLARITTILKDVIQNKVVCLDCFQHHFFLYKYGKNFVLFFLELMSLFLKPLVFPVFYVSAHLSTWVN